MGIVHPYPGLGLIVVSVFVGCSDVCESWPVDESCIDIIYVFSMKEQEYVQQITLYIADSHIPVLSDNHAMLLELMGCFSGLNNR